MEFYFRWIGALLIAAAGILTGFYAAREYKRRVREIEAMIAALNHMQAEIALRLTPMADIFRDLASQNTPCTSFFAAIVTGITEIYEEPLASLWKRMANESFPPSDARDIFAALGSSLGCYDAQQECAAITYTVEQLKRELTHAQEENITQGMLLKRLGAAAGVGLAIIFL